MAVLLTYGVLAGLVIWLAVLLLPWRPWSTRERLDNRPGDESVDLGDITVLVPARNEAAVLAHTLRGLQSQGENLSIVVIDDQSADATAAVAHVHGVQVVPGKPLLPGWTGKVWALEQGRGEVTTPLIALVDADIVLGDRLLGQLRDKLLDTDAGLASLMVELDLKGFWAGCLNPAFVFFFKLLYPFHLCNKPKIPVAAAAGGCVLMRVEALDRIGGFGALRGALIDDCTLASLVKTAGFGTWIGLTRRARSLRGCATLGEIWRTVTRSAYTQLRYSPAWLALCTVLMTAAFVAPILGLVGGGPTTRLAAVVTVLIMMVVYLPTLRYYQRSAAWALAMPLIGVAYLCMTWHSALRYYVGAGAGWKGRFYGRRASLDGSPGGSHTECS